MLHHVEIEMTPKIGLKKVGMFLAFFPTKMAYKRLQSHETSSSTCVHVFPVSQSKSTKPKLDTQRGLAGNARYVRLKHSSEREREREIGL